MCALVMGVGLLGVWSSGGSLGDASAAPEDVPAPKSATLQYEAHRAWPYVLPIPTFTVVSDDQPLSVPGGPTFKTKKDGQSLKIDTNGDGAFNVTARGNDALVRLTWTPEGGAAQMRALRLVNDGGWKFAAGGTWAGKVGGVQLRLIDQNNDGDATDIGEDAIVIGNRTHAQLLSRVVALPDGLFRLRASGIPPTVTLTPYTGKTGVLNLAAGFTSKGRLLSAVVRSMDETRSFDLAGQQDGLRVPIGTYEFVFGQAARGAHRVTIEPGNMPTFKVTVDTPATLTWGGPLVATYSWKRAGDKLQVHPGLVSYAGAAGESYTGFTPPGPSPEFVVTSTSDDSPDGVPSVKEVARARFGGT